MPLITIDDATRHAMHGVTFHSFASSRTGARTLAGWRADFSAHTPGQAHRMDEEEVLLVLAGALDVEIDDLAFTAGEGDAVLVPAGALLRVSNNNSTDAAAWVTTTLGMAATMEADGMRVSPPGAQ